MIYVTIDHWHLHEWMMTNDVLGVCTFTVGGGTDIERCEMNEISTAATVVGLGMYVCM